MFFFSHFIWPSMGDLEVEHVTGSVSNCLWDCFVKAITGGLMKARVLQCWEHSPPTNGDRFKSWPRHHKWFEIVDGLLPCSKRFFPSLQTPTVPNSNSTFTVSSHLINAIKCSQYWKNSMGEMTPHRSPQSLAKRLELFLFYFSLKSILCQTLQEA